MKKVISIVLILALCLSLCACGNRSGSVTVKGETYSIKEFYKLTLENSYKTAQYYGSMATVQGKVTAIKGPTYITNINKYIGTSIVIGNNWSFEVGDDSSILDEIDIGDTVRATGRISHILSAHIYCCESVTVIAE